MKNEITDVKDKNEARQKRNKICLLLCVLISMICTLLAINEIFFLLMSYRKMNVSIIMDSIGCMALFITVGVFTAIKSTKYVVKIDNYNKSQIVSMN